VPRSPICERSRVAPSALADALRRRADSRSSRQFRGGCGRASAPASERFLPDIGRPSRLDESGANALADALPRSGLRARPHERRCCPECRRGKSPRQHAHESLQALGCLRQRIGGFPDVGSRLRRWKRANAR